MSTARCSHPGGCVQLRPHRHTPIRPGVPTELIYDDTVIASPATGSAGENELPAPASRSRVHTAHTEGEDSDE